ncbi:MAG TPA: signal recognition particle-docking protein FtsY [Candidatus Cloacimonadota bacterium]|nr:signal recognition particle-docking protein FtsY [Candidatus Cloacimonadota bacterium]HPT72073.1 signal recognition particle-docking protein FtsY [Candidatus Cloacimonadota bacterium]
MLSFVKNLREKLAKTKSSFIGKIAETIRLRGKVDEELMDELEEILIRSDVGVQMSMEIIDKLRDEIRVNKISDVSVVQERLQKIMSDLLIHDYEEKTTVFDLDDKKPYIILFIGVNGVGKTTTIGKLANRFRKEGKSVMIIAGDTFRAAAIEQVEIWAQRADVTLIKSQSGSDPSAIIFDGINSAIIKKVDVVLIDTAGRQHTKFNLMNELEKIYRTIKKLLPEAPHEVLLVVDATTGQNAITQASTFNKIVPLTGLVLAKLDGTAKGGIVLSIKHELSIPVKLIGVGESIDDLRDFDVREFVDAMFTADSEVSENTEEEEN